jgi:hypothetical protein
MPESQKTPGEIVFERYLNSQSIPFEFEKPHAGKSKRPDYTIQWHNGVARIRFPHDLFNGNCDTHYGIMSIEQGLTFEGEALPDRLKLSKPRKHL